MSGPFYAVLDGAQFDDLATALVATDLLHRPLYNDRGDGDRQRILTAPQFVDLAPDAAARSQAPLDRMLELVGARPTGVVWSCSAGGDSLFRHLRSLNKVLIPRATPSAARDGGADGVPGDTASLDRGGRTGAVPAVDETHEMVLFRHADANVLAQVVPVLEPAQLARLLGPAGAVLFAPDAEWVAASADPAGPERAGAEATVVWRADDWPAPRSGPLRLEVDQYRRMGRVRLEQSRRRLVAYLREVAPDDAAGLDDATLYSRVVAYEESGRELGLKSEAAHGQWAFLMLTTGGRMAEGPPVREALSRAKNPDTAMDELMREMVRLAEGEARGMRVPRGPG